MKYLITTLLFITVIIIGCGDSSTDSDNNSDSFFSHSTVNIKGGVAEYYNFANNLGSTDSTANHDIVFYSVFGTPPGAPASVKVDLPRFRVNNGLSLAVLGSSKLENVTDVPAASKFEMDFVTEDGNWYYTSASNKVLPFEKVYVVNTADGKFPAFQIISYHDDDAIASFYTFKWKYLSN